MALQILSLFSAATTATNAIFLLLSPLKLRRVYRSPIKVKQSRQATFKTITCILYATLQLALLIARETVEQSSVHTTVESSLNLATSIVLIWVSSWSQRRSIRPSNLIVAYLLAKFCCYLAWLPLVGSSSRGTWPLMVQACSSLVLLTFEAQSKRGFLLRPYANEPPETTSSFLGNVLFLWINPILAKGYSKLLDGDEIPPLDQQTCSKHLRQEILRAWDQRKRPENGATLPLVLLRCLQVPFLAAVIPRVLVVIFRFSQPILISHAVRFAAQPSTENDSSAAYWIVLAAAVIYTGVALSTAAYQHRINRLRIMTRGALISLLQNQTLIARGGDGEDDKVVTLVSNDVSTVEQAGSDFHETWGQFTEVVVGTVVLAREVGWLWPVPFAIIFFCSQVSRYVARNIKAAQGEWNKATQQRLAVTSSMLSAIKNVKMLGIQATVVAHIEDLRRQEINAAKGVRWLNVAYNASANALGIFAPVLTIVLYAVLARLQNQDFGAETAFTTIAVLSMITHPANMIMTIAPRAVVSYASFERIQAYLLDSKRSVTSPVNTVDNVHDPLNGPSPAIRLENVTIPSPHDPSKQIVRNITLSIPKGSLTIFTGPVGAGKTTLARAILGELPFMQGSIQLASARIAYAAQTPWLPDETIRATICGPTATAHDETWYQACMEACCLTADLGYLPDGDQTLVGSRGANLSGGQRQRVALARALYARCSTVILDDSISALDGATQEQVVTSLLGEEGLLRKRGATVVWMSTATRYFHVADEVIVMTADGTIKEQGSWEQLRREDPGVDEMIHAGDAEKSVAATNDDKKEPSTLKAPNKPQNKNDLSLYAYYARTAGPLNLAIALTCIALYSIFNTIPPYWIKLWTAPDAPHSTAFYASIYILFLFIAWFTTSVQMFAIVLLLAQTSGLNIHHTLLSTLAAAPLSYLHNPAALLTHFAIDLNQIDRSLSPVFCSVAVQVSKLTAQVAVLLFVTSHPILFLLALPPTALAIYVVQKVYIRTSRPLRQSELAARGATLKLLLDTTAPNGASTLRAFGWLGPAAQAAVEALDEAQRPLYLLLCVQRWLGVVLALLVAAVAVSVLWLALGSGGGEVGVALNVILVLNSTLLKLVECWAGLEVSLGGLARLRAVEMDTPREEGEKPQSKQVGDGAWPRKGRIEFHNVSASHHTASTTTPALRNIALTIRQGQTAVIRGRTGSGKSSLLLSLLRLLDTTAGTISVDGVDLELHSRTEVREKAFITVAQEAFFLPQASLRFNLDAESRASVAAVVDALQHTGLWEHFAGADKDAETVFDTPLNMLPALSTGQSQLLALARALVRRSVLCEAAEVKPIVLLDEVTSSLDPETEARMYHVIREEFVARGHTVVMVTHKLTGMRGWLRPSKDVIISMDEGRVDRVEVVDENLE